MRFTKRKGELIPETRWSITEEAISYFQRGWWRWPSKINDRWRASTSKTLNRDEFVYGLPEALGVVRRWRDKVGVEVFFGCENEVVVLVAQRLERGPVDSRVGAFPEVLKFSTWRTKDLKARMVEVNQGLDLVCRLESFVMTGACLSIKDCK